MCEPRVSVPMSDLKFSFITACAALRLFPSMPFSCVLQRFKSIVPILFATWLVSVSVGTAQAFDVREIRLIGVQASPSSLQQAFINETVRALNMLTEDRIYMVQVIERDALLNEETYQHYHAVIVSPEVFALLERFNGYSALASLGEYDDEGFHSEVTAGIFVPQWPERESQPVVAVKDLSDGKIGIFSNDLPDTRFLIRQEWRQRGLDPQAIHFISLKNLEEAEKALLSKKIDALALSTDMNEALTRQGALIASDKSSAVKLKLGSLALSMVEPRSDVPLFTVGSTPSSPGWVFAASLAVKRDRAASLSATLKSLTFHGKYRWLPAADYDPVLEALVQSNDRVYRNFPTRQWSDILNDHLPWIGLFVLIFLGVIIHSIVAERLVRVRTRELMQTVQKNRRAEKRFEDLERMSAVAQMSNIVAHELRQPLAAVSNFALGLRQRMKNGNLNEEALNFALTRILDENKRASEIVEHVRDYAKRRQRKREKLQLRRLCEKVAGAFLPNDGQPFVFVAPGEAIEVFADSLEMELILRNLVKNAVEALGEAPDRSVIIALVKTPRSVRLSVADNGVATTQEALPGFDSPLMSEKSVGLGLGLSIVRRLAESYDAQMSIELNRPHGVVVSIEFPNEALGR